MRIGILQLHPNACTPEYKTLQSAGADLYAVERTRIPVGQRALVGTGLAFLIPYGYEGQIRPRSGLSMKHGITVVNAPGTIDADYRGEVKVALINLGTDDYAVELGDRIAQVVFAPVTRATFTQEDTLPPTDRGDGGFGSTGT